VATIGRYGSGKEVRYSEVKLGAAEQQQRTAKAAQAQPKEARGKPRVARRRTAQGGSGEAQGGWSPRRLRISHVGWKERRAQGGSGISPRWLEGKQLRD